MFYRDGNIARLGDRVRLNDTEGVVVLSIDTDEYTPDFTREDWAGLLERGVLIDFEKRGLILHIEPDEDLELMSRADE